MSEDVQMKPEAPPETQAATVLFDGGTNGTGTALDTAANWAGDALPTTTSEVLLNNAHITLPTQLTTTGASPTWGSLIWNNNATSVITINTSTTTSRTITLSGGSDVVATTTSEDERRLAVQVTWRSIA